MMITPPQSLTKTLFYHGKKKQNWIFERGELTSELHLIPIANVIALKYTEEKPNKFKLYYAKRKKEKRNEWKLKSLSFQCNNTNDVVLWAKTVQDQLSQRKRPRKLLLFVNPFGGKGNGLKIYEKEAKPLFQIAQVDVNVVITQRKNQIRDIVVDHNFENIDAVSCIGGDGTSSELLNGLILRECQLRNVNPDKRSVKLLQPKITVGLIPGGSTDATVYGVHGTTDVTTAVLHIIMGISMGYDLATVHNENELLQLYSNIASYGFFSDIIYHSEHLRWMGPSRYEYTGFKKILKNQGYKGTLSMLCDDLGEINSRCYENCKKCNETNNDKKNNWVTISGKFFLLAAANIPCGSNRNPNGLAPYCHLGDGYLNILVVHHTTFYRSLKTLHRFTQSAYSINDLPHVKVYRCKEFHFRADGIPGQWNFDGEVLLQPDIYAKVHRKLINVYGRGVYPATNL
ncbi:hypothetical protein FQA39_LY17885 [Lamprigera yunnana]|nr:hypothetical protein FQA39_LY17885 [Lamprigera yunnana]